MIFLATSNSVVNQRKKTNTNMLKLMELKKVPLEKKKKKRTSARPKLSGHFTSNNTGPVLLKFRVNVTGVILQALRGHWQFFFLLMETDTSMQSGGSRN